MKFSDAIDLYITDMRSEGRIRSDQTERAYRDCLSVHADDVSNRDPRTTNRDDVKTTLARWTHPTTRSTRRSVLISFYDWTLQEGHRKDNPARQTRPSRKQTAEMHRLHAGEVIAVWNAPVTILEQRAIRIGLGAGLRSAELRGLQAEHLHRPGFIHVTAAIAKGGRERWVPVITELKLLIDDLRDTLRPGEYVLHGQVNASPGRNDLYKPVPTSPMGATTLWRLVGRVGVRSGIKAPVHPHMMRHAYADHVARHQGIRLAQALLGHADISTTRDYLDAPSIDELAEASRHLRLLAPLPPGPEAANPVMETVGIEPTLPAAQPVEPETDDDPPLASASRALAPVLIRLREAFLPLVQGGAV